MTTFILYQIKTGICIMLFTGLYFLILRKETFYLGNRVYLIGSLLLSCILPLITIPINTQQNSELLISIIKAVYITPQSATNNPDPGMHVPLTMIIYRIIAFVFLLTLLRQLIKMFLVIRKKGIIRLGNYRIVSLTQKEQSFSFFNFIFIASSASNEHEANQVLQHEMAHARQWHSLDIMIIQIFKIFQWFNPFIYLAEKALQETHEYLADEAVMEQDGDSGGYRLLLLTQVFGVQPGIFSLFNYSLFKNRLIMMTKQKSPLRNRYKYLASFPLIMAIVVIFSCTKNPPEPPPPPPPPPPESAVKTTESMPDTTKALVFVDELAKFQNGSLEAFRDWVQQNLLYPEEAVKNGIFGKVMVQFSVNSYGTVDEVKILRGVSPLLDEETVRVIKSSPEWVPAKYQGRNVKQQFVMPVIFKLQ